MSDIFAAAEVTIAIMILALIGLRPLLRKIGQAITSFTIARTPLSEVGKDTRSCVTSGAKQSGKDRSQNLSANERFMNDSHPSRTQGSVNDNEIELTELDSSRVYKTEEITVTHSACDRDEDAYPEHLRACGSHEVDTRFNTMTV